MKELKIIIVIILICLFSLILIYQLVHLKDDDIEEVEEENNNDEDLCPKCGKGRKIGRYNSNDELIFYGCTNFPECDYKERVRKQIIEEKVIEEPEEEIKDTNKYYVDIRIEGYEAVFTYLCPDKVEVNKGDKLYIKDKFGPRKITILTNKYQDQEKDKLYYKKLDLVSEDYQPPIKRYIDVKFISDEGYTSRQTYTYLLPKEYKVKEEDILTIISKYGESKVKVVSNPYTDQEKDKSTFYKEIYIINKEEQ